MSGEEYKNEDQNLKAFEAALAALRPRTDRLDRRWRSLLAKEAALSAESTTERQAAGPLSLWERVRVRAPCVNPAGHRFVCIHCGNEGSGPSGFRRLAWPTAFSGMTAVAAVLLVMFAARSAPQMDRQGVPTPAPSVVQHSGDLDGPEEYEASGGWLARMPSTRRPRVSGVDEMCYLDLRNQVLREGVDSWKPLASSVGTTPGPTEGPLSHREQLERLLEQQGLRGS